jgi:hypothetical protein
MKTSISTIDTQANDILPGVYSWLINFLKEFVMSPSEIPDVMNVKNNIWELFLFDRFGNYYRGSKYIMNFWYISGRSNLLLRLRIF